jgi:hypothetical protein
MLPGTLLWLLVKWLFQRIINDLQAGFWLVSGHTRKGLMPLCLLTSSDLATLKIKGEDNYTALALCSIPLMKIEK